MKRFSAQTIRKTITFISLIFATLIVYVFLQPKPEKRLIFLKKEYTFEQAQVQCEQKDSSLPDLDLLIQLARFEMLPHPTTDYWSSLSLFGFAFGWSTRKMMLSFDPHDDTDHVVCIREK